MDGSCTIDPREAEDKQSGASFGRRKAERSSRHEQRKAGRAKRDVPSITRQRLRRATKRSNNPIQRSARSEFHGHP